MKKSNLLFSVLTLLLATVVIAVIPTDAEGAVYEDTVRLHILANSDSEEDQALKLRVRDAILCEYADELSKIESTDEAKANLTTLLPEIEAFAKAKIADEGYSYDVSVTLSEEWYETREYEDFALPRGYYTSLRVIIGEGEGKNWWCVMFPPICVTSAMDEKELERVLSQKGEEVINGTQKYKVKFYIVELFERWFKG